MNPLLSFAPPFFNRLPPGTHEIARRNCLKMGAGKICSKIKSTCKMLSNEFNFVVCSPFFQQATPGTHEIARKNCLKMGAGKIFSEIKSTCKMLSNESTFVVCS